MIVVYSFLSILTTVAIEKNHYPVDNAIELSRVNIPVKPFKITVLLITRSANCRSPTKLVAIILTFFH